MTTELWESYDPQLRIGLSTLNLNFELWTIFKADKKYFIFIVLNNFLPLSLNYFYIIMDDFFKNFK